MRALVLPHLLRVISCRGVQGLDRSASLLLQWNQSLVNSLSVVKGGRIIAIFRRFFFFFTKVLII